MHSDKEPSLHFLHPRRPRWRAWCGSCRRDFCELVMHARDLLVEELSWQTIWAVENAGKDSTCKACMHSCKKKYNYISKQESCWSPPSPFSQHPEGEAAQTQASMPWPIRWLALSEEIGAAENKKLRCHEQTCQMQRNKPWMSIFWPFVSVLCSLCENPVFQKKTIAIYAEKIDMA